MRLLLVEDHGPLRDMLRAHLGHVGFATDAFARGADALAAASTVTYDAAVLDLRLPDIDGMEVLRRLRRELAPALPVIVLTARDAISARIDGLDAGADDYMLKPFDADELVARLRSVLRRPGGRLPAVARFGDVAFDTVTRTAEVRGASLPLTRREACLLEALARAGGRTVVRDELEERIYGFDDVVSGNALEAIVSRLRRRLLAVASAVTVETVRGIGYRLVATPPP